MDKCLEKDHSGVVAKRPDKGQIRLRKCKDCCKNIKFVARKLFCAICSEKRYVNQSNTTNPKTIAERGLDGGSSGTMDTRREHPEGLIRVHRPDSNQIRNGSGGAGDQLQQHLSQSKKNRKRRIVVGDSEMLLAHMGYRLAKAKQ